MNPVAEKMSKSLKISVEQAAVLIAAGYNCPSKVKAATDEQLFAVPGLKNDSVYAIRTRYQVKAG